MNLFEQPVSNIVDNLRGPSIDVEMKSLSSWYVLDLLRQGKELEEEKTDSHSCRINVPSLFLEAP